MFCISRLVSRSFCNPVHVIVNGTNKMSAMTVRQVRLGFCSALLCGSSPIVSRSPVSSVVTHHWHEPGLVLSYLEVSSSYSYIFHTSVMDNEKSP
jgi:hypothetical protein